MNIYRHQFAHRCPNNDAPISYRLEIRTCRVVMVEEIVGACAALGDIPKPYHESIADHLHALFGGEQTIVGFHHGVEIETVRGE